MIKSIYKNPIANLTLNGARLNAFLLRLRTRQGSNNPSEKSAKDMKRRFTKGICGWQISTRKMLNIISH